MRSNGLTAAAYQPIADVDPLEADILLDELREQLIAAYCQPIETASPARFAELDRRSRALVRLFVDAAATGPASRLVSARDPHLLDGNEDLAWAQIVAGFDVPADDPVARWPVVEDVDAAAAEDTEVEPDADDGPVTAAGRVANVYPEPVGPPADDPTDRFIPPEPPPLPHLAFIDQLGWLGVIGGPVVLLAEAMFSVSVPPWLTLIAALGFVAGFVLLVVRMGRNDRPFDDPDDGAQV